MVKALQIFFLILMFEEWIFSKIIALVKLKSNDFNQIVLGDWFYNLCDAGDGVDADKKH